MQAVVAVLAVLLVVWVVLAYRTPRIVSWLFTPLYIVTTAAVLAAWFCVAEACPDVSSCTADAVRSVGGSPP